jgi:hypothetical protein
MNPVTLLRQFLSIMNVLASQNSALKGDNMGWHRYEYDYIVISYFREVGVEHDVINGNDFEYAFFEIKFVK